MSLSLVHMSAGGKVGVLGVWICKSRIRCHQTVRPFLHTGSQAAGIVLFDRCLIGFRPPGFLELTSSLVSQDLKFPQMLRPRVEELGRFPGRME